MKDPAPPPAVAVDDVEAAAPPPRRAEDDWLEAARSSTYITGEPSFVSEFWLRVRDVNKKYVIRGYNWRFDIRVADMMESELVDLLYTIAGLVPWDERAKTLVALDTWCKELEKIDVMLRIPHLRFEISAWVYRTRLGLPPQVDRSEFDLDVDKLFMEHYARINATLEELAKARKYREKVLKK